jgi:carbamoyl-phosphate synthase large subunit
MRPKTASASRNCCTISAQAAAQPHGAYRSPTRLRLAAEIGYPLVVRPSYVLGGRAMEIVHEPRDLERYMREAVKVSNDSPVLLDRFLNDAMRSRCRRALDGNEVIIGGVMEHIEQAGVHSGDSACSLPPYSLSKELQDELRRQTKLLMAKGLKVNGLMNVQFAIQNDVVYVLEVNPRASRTVPFVSKATGLQLAKIAARCMAGQSLASQGVTTRKSSRRTSRSRKPFSPSSSSPASTPFSARK